MKSLKVFFFTLFVIASIQVVSVYAVEEEEIIVLIETAETPEDHGKIVDYYEAKALEMETLANIHKAMAASYKKRSKPLSGMPEHCTKLSQKYTESAYVYGEMAKHHKKMAEGKQNHDSHQHE